jgi:hypothetical protein
VAGLTDPLGPFAQPLDALATEVARGGRTRQGSAAEPQAVLPEGQDSKTA